VEWLYTFGLLAAYIDTRFFVAERVFVGSVLLLIALTLPGFLLHWAFLRRLRVEHAATWRSLGKPSVVYYGSHLTGIRVMRFIRDRAYLKLGDPYLDGVCTAYRLCVLAYTAAFLGLLSGSTMLFVASL
jgi:hypothetical protein